MIGKLKRRRGDSDELLAYKERKRWTDVRSGDINEYIKEIPARGTHREGLPHLERHGAHRRRARGGGRGGPPQTGRKRAIARAIKEIAHYLGNTPAVCRASYIDPRVFDPYKGGLIIRPAARKGRGSPGGELSIHQPKLERAVLDLIDERAAAPGVERIAACSAPGPVAPRPRIVADHG